MQMFLHSANGQFQVNINAAEGQKNFSHPNFQRKQKANFVLRVSELKKNLLFRTKIKT
jgi:hypothetical protein